MYFLCTANSVLADNIGYRTSLGYTTVSIVMDFGESEGDSLSYIHLVTNNFRLKMPKSAKITIPANNSNRECTPYGAKSDVSSTSQNINQQGDYNSNNGSNINGYVKNLKIVYGISGQELRNALKSVLLEFIENGTIDLKQSKL
ncbi:hypothetical protein ACILE2_11150 [Capnocytophaga canimorsus]|uniref:hypothetical protein n=1 Tax=Capnocytophaga canimorsus TaxID=28188 RepID=UPI0037D16829